MAKCKLTNRWLWSLDQAAIMIDSPKGGCVYVRKSAVNNLTPAQLNVVLKCADCMEMEIDLSIDEMWLLLGAAKDSKGIWRVNDVSNRCTKGSGLLESIPKGNSVVANFAAPQTKVPQQKTYAQRLASQRWKIAAMNQATLQGTCPNCSKGGLKVKRHETWAGFFCSKCNQGGSLTYNKK